MVCLDSYWANDLLYFEIDRERERKKTEMETNKQLL